MGGHGGETVCHNLQRVGHGYSRALPSVVDSENASVFELTLEEGAQVVTTNALKVSKTFKTNRSLNNKWTTFGSPIELTASAEYGSGLILYAATGYTAKEAVAQGWEEVSVLYGKRVDLTAGSPYLLAADAALTGVTFRQTAPDEPESRQPYAPWYLRAQCRGYPLRPSGGGLCAEAFRGVHHRQCRHPLAGS